MTYEIQNIDCTDAELVKVYISENGYIDKLDPKFKEIKMKMQNFCNGD